MLVAPRVYDLQTQLEGVSVPRNSHLLYIRSHKHFSIKSLSQICAWPLTFPPCQLTFPSPTTPALRVLGLWYWHLNIHKAPIRKERKIKHKATFYWPCFLSSPTAFLCLPVKRFFSLTPNLELPSSRILTFLGRNPEDSFSSRFALFLHLKSIGLSLFCKQTPYLPTPTLI